MLLASSLQRRDEDDFTVQTLVGGFYLMAYAKMFANRNYSEIRELDIMTAITCSLHAYRLLIGPCYAVSVHVCVCSISKHASSSSDSFAMVGGLWSIFVTFSLPYFGT
jgi:hypothetical protein